MEKVLRATKDSSTGIEIHEISMDDPGLQDFLFAHANTHTLEVRTRSLGRVE